MADVTSTRRLVDGLDAANPVKREKHPAWYPPQPAARSRTGLQLLNSLTETVEPFFPRHGRHVTWYTCGPTVYDASHLGHARAYLTFDILRRIMEDYFGYSVHYQMNITDIDDKIIKRARVNKLLGDYKAKMLAAAAAGGSDAWDTLVAFTAEALAGVEAGARAKRAALTVPLPSNTTSRQRTEREEKLLELDLKDSQLAETKAAIEAALPTRDMEQLFAVASGVLGERLDELEGKTIVDQRIFEAHARKYERMFFEDMQRLGVREPDVVTRVTEYVPQVVDFIGRIVDNGFAYKAQSSVLFDTEAYLRAGHSYPKLKAGGEKNATEEEMAEGEGVLSAGVTGEKRSPNDFALWKLSKEGEPRWPSPWGDGRPGWHIECSVMASDILGENMDIHGGGWDLKFPHHDNECAQSEAFHQNHQWVNYFLHCGHLHIKGLKMSKSLKNFITIRQALDELGVTPRTMRLLFLSFAWSKPMNFSDQSINESREKERVLRSFFGSVEIVLRRDPWSQSQGYNAADRQLQQQWVDAEQKVHEALQNNFDTPSAMDAIMGLVSATNQYLQSCSDAQPASWTLIRKVGRYVTRMMTIFGVVGGADDIGFLSQQPQAPGSGEAGGAMDPNARFIAVTDALVRFREEVRDTAKAEKQTATFLPLCDKVRDSYLVCAGVRIEDDPAGPTTWKNDDPEILRREMLERAARESTERLKKMKNQLETKRKLVEKWRQATVAPGRYFIDVKPVLGDDGANRFSAFDEATGLPTTLAVGGTAVDEKTVKKLKKDLDKYAKLHEEFQQKGGAEWLAREEAELAEMVKRIRDLEDEVVSSA